MSKKYEFIGLPAGDGESFCWHVTPDVFKQITGEEPIGWDYVEKEYEWDNENNLIFTKLSELVYLYPDSLFRKENFFERYGNCKIIIEIEEIID